MHRSGTSVTSRILNMLGTFLGAEGELIPAHPKNNPTGYWEHVALTDISDQLLGAFGGSWHTPPDLPSGWEASPSVAPLRRQARSLLRNTFAEERLWGWKDPRAALTIAFWQRLVPGARYVICVRNPLDVAASLARRNELSAHHCHELWFRHIAGAILNTRGRPRLFVCFEDYFDSGDLQIRRLARFVGADRRLARPTVEQALDGFLDSQLRHHQASLIDALDDPGLPLRVKSLYLALVAATRPHADKTKLAAGLLGEPLDALTHDLATEARRARLWETVARTGHDAGAHTERLPVPDDVLRLPTVDTT